MPAPRTKVEPAAKESVAANPFVRASGEEVVWCDVCTGVKRPATSSCLTCTASYCTEHEQPHRTSSFYAKHPLMDPREALRGRTCSVHRRLLEVGETARCVGKRSSSGDERFRVLSGFTRRSSTFRRLRHTLAHMSIQECCVHFQVYCRICQRCICAICVLEEHRTHKTVSVQTERLVKQVRRWNAC